MIKILNLGHGGDMTKRKQHRFKGGKIIDVEEYHDGRYGAPGCKREKKKNPTKEQIQKINAWNKATCGLSERDSAGAYEGRSR